MPEKAEPKLLVIDTAFTLEAIRERKLEHSILCRDLSGFFSHGRRRAMTSGLARAGRNDQPRIPSGDDEPGLDERSLDLRAR